MNQTTRYVMDIYQVSVIVRDTLEYLIQKKDGLLHCAIVSCLTVYVDYER